jgi:hypothetical protein
LRLTIDAHHTRTGSLVVALGTLETPETLEMRAFPAMPETLLENSEIMNARGGRGSPERTTT